jgi:hypothetical protein
MSMTDTTEHKFPTLPKVHYEQTTALYSSQFVISANGEEVIINFSSGSVPDSKTGENFLPIHTRIALSSNGARKLANLINQAVTAAQNSQVFESTTKVEKLHS